MPKAADSVGAQIDRFRKDCHLSEEEVGEKIDFFAWRRERIQKLSEDKSVRIEVLKLLAMDYHCTLADVYEKTGATFDLLVEIHAAGELYLSSSGWVMRERPKNR